MLPGSVTQRADLIRHGLAERAPSVKKVAVELLKVWLDEACGGDVLKLLKLLEVRVHEGKHGSPSLPHQTAPSAMT